MPEELIKPPQTPEEAMGVTQEELDSIFGHQSSMSWQLAVRSVFKDNARAERYISLTEQANDKVAIEPESTSEPVAEPTLEPDPEPVIVSSRLGPEHPAAFLDEMRAQAERRKADEADAAAARHADEEKKVINLLAETVPKPPTDIEPNSQ